MRVAAMVVALVSPWSAICAQRIDTRFIPATSGEMTQIFAPRDTAPPGDGPKITGALLGGVLGMISGAVVGLYLEKGASNDCTDYCGLAGFLLGGVAGEGIGFGWALHIVDPQPGRLAVRIAGPLAVAGAGLLGAIAVEHVWPLIFVVPLQFAIAF